MGDSNTYIPQNGPTLLEELHFGLGGGAAGHGPRRFVVTISTPSLYLDYNQTIYKCKLSSLCHFHDNQDGHSA